MKRTIPTVLTGVLLVVLASCWGCGARVEVAKDKVMKKIDSLLGETDVQKKEVQIAMRKNEQATDELAKGRITVQVQSDRLEKQVKDGEQKIADADASLRKLREYLTSGGPVEIAGKTYATDKVKEMADKILNARKALGQQCDTLKQSRDRLEKTASQLAARESGAKDRLVRLKLQWSELETQMVALKALKDASQVAGDSDKTFADNFDDLEKKVAALQDKVKIETSWEEEKWKALDAKKEIDSVDSIIAATKSNQDTVAEIDKVLGGK